MDPAELAVILAYGDRHGDKAAASNYKVSERTLQRYRLAIREGRAPELAGLVAKQKGKAVERCLDLLTETYEIALKRLQAVLATTESTREVTEAVRVVGELQLTRKALGDDDADGSARSGAEAQGASGREAQATH